MFVRTSLKRSRKLEPNVAADDLALLLREAPSRSTVAASHRGPRGCRSHACAAQPTSSAHRRHRWPQAPRQPHQSS